MSYPSRTLSSLLGIAVAGTACVYAARAAGNTALGVPPGVLTGLDKPVASPRAGDRVASPRVEHVASSRVEKARPAPPAPAPAPAQRQVLDRYCVTCHNERLKTGGLVLEKIDLDRVSANAETLE